MIGGASWVWWIGFHIAVVGLLILDSLLPRGKSERQSRKWDWAWTVVLALAALGFAAWVAIRQGHEHALQFIAGYAIETSLSIDNLFVFLLLFQGFTISRERQRTALSWGIAGAIALRALFIALGVTLINNVDWISYVFGAFLVYAAWRLMRGGSARAAIPGWVQRMQPKAGSLLPVILAVEVTDVLFAIDSIPAVLAVSHDPFIVYTSNIAAVLGLRSLYFVLAGLLDRLRFLHYGLGALLLFMAFKMLASHWLDVPTVLSLAIIGAILAVCAVASALAPKRPESASSSNPGA